MEILPQLPSCSLPSCSRPRRWAPPQLPVMGHTLHMCLLTEQSSRYETSHLKRGGQIQILPSLPVKCTAFREFCPLDHIPFTGPIPNLSPKYCVLNIMFSSLYPHFVHLLFFYKMLPLLTEKLKKKTCTKVSKHIALNSSVA